MVENNYSVCPLCGKFVDKNLNFCTFCGASLSKQIKTKNDSELPTQLTITDQDRAILNQLILDKNKKEIIKFIKNLFEKSSSNSLFLRKIYDLIGEMLIEYPEYFMEELYRRLYKKCIYRLGKILSPQ